MQDLILEKLYKKIKNTDNLKSSHWKKFLTKDSNVFNKLSHFGFGSYTKKGFKNLFYDFLNKKIFGEEIFNSKTYKLYKSIFDQTHRYIDIDTIRHILTFEKLKAYVNPKKICIIGDGKLNGVLGAHLSFPEAKIYNVNLTETLINDYLILKELNIELNNSIGLVDKIDFKEEKKLNFIPANFKNYLMNKNIDFFITIAAFQEMTVGEIDNYFKIISSNNSTLYCCSREYKKLVGGEEIYFDKYPWSNSKKIFWENCPWNQKWSSLRYPFIHKYDGQVKHCLVDFS